MRIGITGSWKGRDKESWQLLSDFNSFKDACYQIGAAGFTTLKPNKGWSKGM